MHQNWWCRTQTNHTSALFQLCQHLPFHFSLKHQTKGRLALKYVVIWKGGHVHRHSEFAVPSVPAGRAGWVQSCPSNISEYFNGKTVKTRLRASEAVTCLHSHMQFKCDAKHILKTRLSMTYTLLLDSW